MMEITQLSFIDDSSGKRCFWSVNAESLTIEQQSLLGRSMAYDTMNFIQSTGFSPLFGWIVKDMKENFGHVEISFLHAFCSRACQVG